MDANESELRDALTQSAGYLLSAASRKLKDKMTEALAPLNLSLYDYVVLRLVGLQARLSQGSLGDIYGIDPATMVALIDKLEQTGLLLRERDPQDRRRYLLRLTPRGSKTLSRARRAVGAQQKQFLSPLSEDEWNTVRHCLYKLVCDN